MGYLIDARPAAVAAGHRRAAVAATIVLVGCGGTGGFLAEALCRLLIGKPAGLYLVDMDRVEPHNVARQHFDRHEVGRFKAETLAERLMRRYGREIGYAVAPYDPELHADVFNNDNSALQLLVGCVDNAPARRAIAETLEVRRRSYAGPGRDVWWLDSGNSRNDGQVLLGNALRAEDLQGGFLPDAGCCRALPAPSLQIPSLLDAPPQPATVPRAQLDCAEAVIAGDQGPVINQFVAAIAAGYVEKLLAGTCGWMASYFDLDAGSLRCVTADPQTVAELAGLHHFAVALYGARVA